MNSRKGFAYKLYKSIYLNSRCSLKRRCSVIDRRDRHLNDVTRLLVQRPLQHQASLRRQHLEVRIAGNLKTKKVIKSFYIPFKYQLQVNRTKNEQVFFENFKFKFV